MSWLPLAAARARSAHELAGESPRRVAESLVERIRPKATWTVDSFVVSESIRRNRPIRVVMAGDATSLGDGISGQLWPFESYDEIVVKAGLSVAERRYVIAHEMGHLLLEHPRRASADQWTAWLNALPPGLVNAHVGSFACRVGPRSVNDSLPTTDSQRAEQEAEWFATILLAVVDEKRDRIAYHKGHDRGLVMIDRIATTFGYY